MIKNIHLPFLKFFGKTKSLVFLTFISSTLFCALNSNAQIDTEFWFAVPNICNNHSEGDNVQELRLASFNTVAVTVTIDIPANPLFPVRNVTIPAGGSLLQTFAKVDVEIDTNNGPTNRGLRIRASLPITAYYEIGRGTPNTEIFSLKGRNALGTRFYTPFQNKFETENRFYPEAQSSINIIATEDNTSITITLPAGKSAAGWATGEITRTVNLNRGQTYSVASSSPLGAGRLTGTLITSNKPIAVTISDDSITVDWGADLAGDQIVPTTVIGTQYLIPPGRLNYIDIPRGITGSNVAYIVAVQDGTNIDINNVRVATGLNAGQTFPYTMPNPGDADANQSRFLESSSPVYVLYHSGFGMESGSPLLPTIKCTGSSKVSFVRSTNQTFFLTILAQDDAIGNFTIEGGGAVQAAINNPSNYTDNATFPGWKVFQQITNSIPVDAAITVSNSRGYFHLGLINGEESGGSARFGYFSDYGVIDTELPATLSVCPNTPISLDPKVFGSITTVWKRNGILQNFPVVNGAISFSVPSQIDPNVPDLWEVEITDNRQCKTNDNMRITVFPKPNVDLNIEGNRNVCSNDQNALIIPTVTVGTVANPAGYLWTYTGAGNAGAMPNRPAQQHLPTTGGTYRVTITDANNCKDFAEVNVTYNIAKQVDITNQVPITCSNNIPTLAVINSPAYTLFTDYVWTRNATQVATSTTFTPTLGGDYRLSVKDEFGCTTSDNNSINLVPTASLTLNLASPVICSAGNTPITMTTNAPSLQSLSWFLNNASIHSGVNNRSWLPTAIGTYKVDLRDNNGCDVSRSVAVTKFSNTVPVVLNNPPTTVCSNADYALTHAIPSVIPNFKTYVWKLNGNIIGGASTNSYKPTGAGSYTLEVVDNNDCPSADSKSVNWTVAQTFNLGADQNEPICTNGNYLITVPNNFTITSWTLNNTAFTPSSGNVNGGRTHKPAVGQSGTIEVKAKDANTCDASDAVFIGSVVDPAAVTLTQPLPNVCSNAGFVINATPSNLRSYSWLIGANTAPNATNSPQYTPRATGTYTVNAVDLNWCNTSANVAINFVDTLALNLNTPPTTFCANNTTYRITPSGGPFVSYEFSRNNQIINPISGPGVSHRPILSGTYLVVGTDARSCKSRRTVTINYQDTANFKLPQLPTVICDNANGNNTTTIINATGPYVSYAWTLNNNPLIANVSASQHRPIAAGTYRVTVTDANTCTASDRVVANYFVPLKMTLTPTPSGTIACWNTNYTLTPTAGFTTYDWRVTTAPALTIPINTFAYKPLQSGKYKVIGTDPNTCKSADSVSLTYIPDFKLDLGKVKAVCSDVPFTIDATKQNIVSYVWTNTASKPNPPITQSTFLVSGAASSGKYAVKLTDINGCADQDTLDFQIVAKLPLDLGPDRFACSYQNFAVDATPNFAKYEWTNDAGETNPGIAISKFTVKKTGKYTVLVTDASGLCFATDDVFITYVPDLNFNLVNNPTAVICFNDLYPARFILAVDSLKFTTLAYDWSWKVPNGEVQPLNVAIFQPNISGQYIARVQEKVSKCFDSDTTVIDFSRLLTNFDLGGPNRTVCIDVKDSITSTLPEYRGATFKWTWTVPTGAVNPTPKTVSYPNITGGYKVDIEDKFGCKASDLVNVQFSDSLLDFDLGGPEDQICISNSGVGKIIRATNVKYDNISNYTWKWTVPTEETNPGTNSQTSPKTSGNYTVRITDMWGCDTVDSKDIKYYDDLFGFKIKSPVSTICFNAPISDKTIKSTDNKFADLSIYQWAWTLPANSKILRKDSSAVVVDTSGKYLAKITNKLTTCDNSDSTTVLYSDSLLALTFNKSFDTICFNEPLKFQTIQATQRKYDNLTNYTWNWKSLPGGFPNPGNKASVLPDRSGLFRALVTDVHGCKDSASTQVNFDKSLQDLDLGPDSITVCFNIQRLLTDSAYTRNEFVWLWNVPEFSKITDLNKSNVAPDTTGKYVALVTNRFKCSNKDSVEVQYSDSLRAFKLFKPSDTICFNAKDLRRKVSTDVKKYYNINEYTWTWAVPDGATNPGNNFEAIPNKSGTYTANLKDRWGCPASDQTSVTFSDDLSGFDLGKPVDTICFNVPKFITSTLPQFKTNIYTWQWTTFPTGSRDPAGSQSFEAKATGQYIVRVINKELCDNRDTVFVNFSDSLAAFSLGDLGDTVCATRPSDTLRATVDKYNNLNNYRWSWDVPAGQQNVGNFYKIFPRFAGNYTATVKDRWECAAAKLKIVTYGDSIKIGLGNGDTTACSTSDYVINAGSGFVKYIWSIPDYTESSYRPTLSGKYHVTVTDRLGCTGSDTVNVLYVLTLLTDLPFVKDICDSDTAISFIKAKSGFDSYQWMDEAVGTDSTYKPLFPRFSGASFVQIISLKVTRFICSANASTTVTFIKKDEGSLGNDTTICIDYKVVLDAGRNFSNYSWKSRQTGDSIIGSGQQYIANRPDEYYVDLVSSCGLSTPTINISNFDTIKTSFIPDSLLCVGEKLLVRDLTENVKNKYHYTWYEKNSQTFIQDTVGNIETKVAGNFQVIVRDKNKCFIRDSVMVAMTDDCFIIPNLFTPNGDAYNPTFFIRGIYAGEWSLEVYNRWGDRVYLNSMYDNSWDASNVDAGVYFYELKHAVKSKKYKGWVQVAK